MSNHSKWGNRYDNQIEAFLRDCNIDEETTVPELRIFGLVLRGAYKKQVTKYYDKLSTRNGKKVPDNVMATRTFKHRCGLMKAINALSGTGSTMTMYLDGYPNVKIDISGTEFVFDPQHAGNPIAEVVYEEFGTRHGEEVLRRSTSFVSLIFKDEAQLRGFVVATTTTPDPTQQTTSGASGSSYNPSSSGSSPIWPLAVGALIGVAMSD